MTVISTRTRDWTTEERRELVEKYVGCNASAEKQALAEDYGLSLSQLYNLYSRWYSEFE